MGKTDDNYNLVWKLSSKDNRCILLQPRNSETGSPNFYRTLPYKYPILKVDGVCKNKLCQKNCEWWSDGKQFNNC